MAFLLTVVLVSLVGTAQALGGYIYFADIYFEGRVVDFNASHNPFQVALFMAVAHSPRSINHSNACQSLLILHSAPTMCTCRSHFTMLTPADLLTRPGWAGPRT